MNQALERLRLAFTGATSSFYEPSRQAMKRVCHYWDIGTPAYVIASNSEDFPDPVWPLMAKTSSLEKSTSTGSRKAVKPRSSSRSGRTYAPSSSATSSNASSISAGTWSTPCSVR